VLPISFQFHHAQMDGLEAAHFLNDLQAEFKKLSI
jgi:chloramphenicol O-acetyltransferase type A